MKYNDCTIPITCAVCQEEQIGVYDMYLHILREHPEYCIQEAYDHARFWADAAYDEMEAQDQALTAQNRKGRALPPIPRGIA